MYIYIFTVYVDFEENAIYMILGKQMYPGTLYLYKLYISY